MNYLLLVTFCPIVSFVKGMPSNAESSNGSVFVPTWDSNSCNMLQTNKFSLNWQCIENSRAAQTAIQRLSSPTLQECKRRCCEWEEGPCDLVYWNNLNQCQIMNYYILTLCPLQSNANQAPATQFTLLLSVSRRVNQQLRMHLLRSGYRNELQTRLGCGHAKFVCDNWDCIDKKLMCDGKPHCSDNSDEAACSKCLGSDGQYVSLNDQYIPHDQSDSCKICKCGKNSTPIYCYSATCYLKQPADCQKGDLCCQCHKKANYPELGTPPTEVPFANLSETQRLIVSCMSVLVVITLLLFLSRNILHGGRRALYQNHGYFSRRRATRVNHCQASGRYWRDSDSVSFFETETPPNRPFPDLPPSYNQLKPLGYFVTTNSEETLGPPPSYRSDGESNAGSNAGSKTPETSRSASLQVDQSTSGEIPTPSGSDSPPVSPLSTSSVSPLFSAQGENSRA